QMSTLLLPTSCRLLSSLFFSCSGDHRHLHSFPTRRSSDLPATPPGQRTARRLPGAPAPARHGTGPAHGPGRWRGNGSRCGWVHTDRKSTRLNSSHVKISYAVFCLKKKNKKDKK